jgi:predicted NodU family carbamoyl transferase
LRYTPILANTSINVAGQAMVDTPEDAEEFFEVTPVDVLFVGARRLAR